MAIRHWPKKERPREKLLLSGATALSNAELLSILLRHGIKGTSALASAQLLLETFAGLRGVINASKEQLCALPGIGETRYCELQACREMARRYLAEPLFSKPLFSCADDVAQYLKAELRDLPHEVFAMLLLDSQHHLLAFRKMFFGTINAAAVYPRELVKQALCDNAAAVILVHNHPSGIAEPSSADIQLTKDVKNAMELVDIDVLDHFIVGDNVTLSLAQRGLV